MTFRTLIRRSLRFHWRSHLGVVLGAAIGSAALIGALEVGDSVKGSLRERALERLGWMSFALGSGDRLVTEDLRRKLDRSIGNQSKAASATNRESGGRDWVQEIGWLRKICGANWIVASETNPKPLRLRIESRAAESSRCTMRMRW